MEEMFQKKTTLKSSLVMLAAANCENENIFEFIWMQVKKLFKVEIQHEMLLEEDWEGDIALDYAFENRSVKSFALIKDLYVELIHVEKMKKSLSKKKTDGSNILLYSLGAPNLEYRNIRTFWNYIQSLFLPVELKEILLEPNNNGLTILEICKQYKEVKEIFLPFIDENFNQAERAKHYLIDL